MIEKKKKDETISIRFPRWLFDFISEKAIDEERSKGAQVVYYIKRYIEEHPEEKEALGEEEQVVENARGSPGLGQHP